RDARRRAPRDRRLRRPLPPPPAQRAELPHTRRGASDLGGWTTTTENGGLACQRRRGAGQSDVTARNGFRDPCSLNRDRIVLDSRAKRPGVRPELLEDLRHVRFDRAFELPRPLVRRRRRAPRPRRARFILVLGGYLGRTYKQVE